MRKCESNFAKSSLQIRVHSQNGKQNKLGNHSKGVSSQSAVQDTTFQDEGHQTHKTTIFRNALFDNLQLDRADAFVNQ